MNDLYDLIIYDEDGDRVDKFPCEHITYEIIEGKLHVSYLGALHTYRLDRFWYCIEGR